MVLFTIVRVWNLSMSSIVVWIKKLEDEYIMEYYVSIKKIKSGPE